MIKILLMFWDTTVVVSGSPRFVVPKATILSRKYKRPFLYKIIIKVLLRFWVTMVFISVSPRLSFSGLERGNAAKDK